MILTSTHNMCFMEKPWIITTYPPYLYHCYGRTVRFMFLKSFTPWTSVLITKLWWVFLVSFQGWNINQKDKNTPRGKRNATLEYFAVTFKWLKWFCSNKKHFMIWYLVHMPWKLEHDWIIKSMDLVILFSLPSMSKVTDSVRDNELGYTTSGTTLSPSDTKKYKFRVFLVGVELYKNIWAGPWENVSYVICEQQRRRSACASAQSDQRLCCSLLR